MESQVEEVGSNFEDGSPGLCGKALRRTPLWKSYGQEKPAYRGVSQEFS